MFICGRRWSKSLDLITWNQVLALLLVAGQLTSLYLSFTLRWDQDSGHLVRFCEGSYS